MFKRLDISEICKMLKDKGLDIPEDYIEKHEKKLHKLLKEGKSLDKELEIVRKKRKALHEEEKKNLEEYLKLREEIMDL